MLRDGVSLLPSSLFGRDSDFAIEHNGRDRVQLLLLELEMRLKVCYDRYATNKRPMGECESKV